LESLIASGQGLKANVAFKGSKMHQLAVPFKRGHCLLKAFYGFGAAFFRSDPHVLQYLLYIG
jgi:hypothetical protein